MIGLLASVESDVLFHVAEALEIPVLVLTGIAAAWTLLELGRFLVEVACRRRRDPRHLDEAAERALEALRSGEDRDAARTQLRAVAWSPPMDRAVAAILRDWGRPGEERRISKTLADFDFASLRRLERTRLLVRAGPALGLMGTLIPLSPALAGLAGGDVATLTENLRVAFSVTVVGLLIGAVAFAVSLVRDRLYGQDLSDLEYLAATITDREAS